MLTMIGGKRMNSYTYCVMHGDIVLGRGMSIDDACLFLKALMEQYYNKMELTLAIRRESYDVTTC